MTGFAPGAGRILRAFRRSPVADFTLPTKGLVGGSGGADGTDRADWVKLVTYYPINSCVRRG